MRITMMNYKSCLGEAFHKQFLMMVQGLEIRNSNLEIWLLDGKLRTKSPYA